VARSVAADPFGALADPHRRALVERLGHGPCSVGELAAGLPISRPAVSRHLRVLREAGLVTAESRGRLHLYRLDEGGADEIRRYLGRVWGDALGRFRLLAENTTREASSRS
jgi:DNA-binding transcriptional ArsR family regulator